MLFPPCPQDVELKFRYPMCFILQNWKNRLFLEARSNCKITLIKTKDIVIFHGNNNDGNNDYCEQRIR